MGRETPERGRAVPLQPLERDAAHLLDALEAGILILSRDLYVEYANARWSTWLEVPVGAGVQFASLLGDDVALVLDELRAALADGEPRMLALTLRGGRDIASRR